jgi:hypothetical protein
VGGVAKHAMEHYFDFVAGGHVRQRLLMTLLR